MSSGSPLPAPFLPYPPFPWPAGAHPANNQIGPPTASGVLLCLCSSVGRAAILATASPPVRVRPRACTSADRASPHYMGARGSLAHWYGLAAHNGPDWVRSPGDPPAGNGKLDYGSTERRPACRQADKPAAWPQHRGHLSRGAQKRGPSGAEPGRGTKGAFGFIGKA